jgi:hypothetical protein
VLCAVVIPECAWNTPRGAARQREAFGTLLATAPEKLIRFATEVIPAFRSTAALTRAAAE